VSAVLLFRPDLWVLPVFPGRSLLERRRGWFGIWGIGRDFRALGPGTAIAFLGCSAACLSTGPFIGWDTRVFKGVSRNAGTDFSFFTCIQRDRVRVVTPATFPQWWYPDVTCETSARETARAVVNHVVNGEKDNVA